MINSKAILKKENSPEKCYDVDVSKFMQDKKLDMLYPNLKSVLKSKSVVGFPMNKRPEVFPVKFEH